MGFWDDFQKYFKKGVSVVAQKTDEYTKIGKIKVDIISIKREIDKRNTELGSKVFQLIAVEKNSRISTNEDVKVSIEKIGELNERITQKKAELDNVRQEYADRTGEPMKDEPVEATVEEVKEEAKG